MQEEKKQKKQIKLLNKLIELSEKRNEIIDELLTIEMCKHSTNGDPIEVFERSVEYAILTSLRETSLLLNSIAISYYRTVSPYKK